MSFHVSSLSVSCSSLNPKKTWGTSPCREILQSQNSFFLPVSTVLAIRSSGRCRCEQSLSIKVRRVGDAIMISNVGERLEQLPSSALSRNTFCLQITLGHHSHILPAGSLEVGRVLVQPENSQPIGDVLENPLVNVVFTGDTSARTGTTTCVGRWRRAGRR